MKAFYSLFYISTVVFFIINTEQVYSQESDVQQQDTKEVVIIALDNISEESERVNQDLASYKDVLVQSPSISEIDSLLTRGEQVLNQKKDSLFQELETISKRQLKIRNVEWTQYKSELKSYQTRINSRTAEISRVNDKILEEIATWENTKKEFEKNSTTTDIYDNLDKVIAALKDIQNIATKRVEAIFVTEKRLTTLVLITDNAIAEIKALDDKFRQDNFVFDSPPIWDLAASKELDSLSQLGKEKVSIGSTIESNAKLVQSFFTSNLKIFALQIGFIALLLITLILTRQKWKVKFKELQNPIEIQSKIVLKHYFASAIVLGVLISAFFYDALIPAVGEFFVLIIFLGTIVLLPKLTTKRFNRFLILLIFSYLLYLTGSYIDYSPSFFRIYTLVNLLVLMYALYVGRHLVKSNPSDFTRLKRLFKIASTVFLFLTAFAILANIIGMVELSKTLLFAVQSSTILLMVIHVSIIVLTSLIVLVFKLRRKTYGLQAVSTIVDATHKRIQPILFWSGIIVWLSIVLRAFGIREMFIDWLDEALSITWEVGEMTISLGGVLSFLGIFTITILVAKLIGSIFQDEWMIKILPKGVAPASSLLLRIVLISIGLYIGLSAAGVNLSQLGFIVGALGVGIGFGLQNVVLNFIAGLILAFERPINLGDAIQIDNEFGVVTNIGIRSSNIKSYNGYEAIIPNGDLISKKVINWTLSNRDRRSRKFLKTAPTANPEEMISLFNSIAAAHEKTFKEPEPRTFFKGYDENGNLEFELWYWSSFSDTLGADHDIVLTIYNTLKEQNVQAPVPARRIIK